MRRTSKKIRLGNLYIGGDSPITVQSMCNVLSSDFEGILSQSLRLQSAGCDILRISVPDEDSSRIFSYLKSRGVSIPLVADIHFDYKLALLAAKNGADKIRINPGNIGEKWKIKEVTDICSSLSLPIRIGVNSGSLDKKILDKYGSASAEALAESALTQADVFESLGFSDVVLSIKSSDTIKMIKASSITAENSDYPIHLGVTEAGDDFSGLIKNSIGIGTLLQQGIGDTIRVSLSADPVREVQAGREILNSLGLLDKGFINIISCPTCGRTKIDIISLVSHLKEALADVDPKDRKIDVAVMGCAVNGPGEAREADIGIAGGIGEGLLFKKGEIICKVKEDLIIPVLKDEIIKIVNGD